MISNEENYEFYYKNLQPIIIKMCKNVRASYQPQEDLYQVAQMALIEAGVQEDADYSALNYTIMLRALYKFLDKHYKFPPSMTEDGLETML